MIVPAELFTINPMRQCRAVSEYQMSELAGGENSMSAVAVPVTLRHHSPVAVVNFVAEGSVQPWRFMFLDSSRHRAGN